VLAVGLVAVAGGYGYARFRFAQISSVRLPGLARRTAGTGAPFNVLVVGSDTRADLRPGEAAAYGSSTAVTGQRSDVMMVVHLDPGTGRASILSIPRDLLVPIAGTGRRDRINAAFSGGPGRLVATIQGGLGIPIHHYLLVNFDGFQAIVNALGGIDLDFPYRSRDAYSGLDVTRAGCQHLGGHAALALARSRHFEYWKDGSWHVDPLSDLSRIRRQQTFLRAVVARARSRGLTDPLAANAFVGAVVHDITKDSALSVGEAVGLVSRFRSLDSKTLASYTLPTTAATGYPGYGDVLLLRQAAARQVVARFLGRPATVSQAGAGGHEASVGGTTAPRPSSAPAPALPATAVPGFDPRPC